MNASLLEDKTVKNWKPFGLTLLGLLVCLAVFTLPLSRPPKVSGQQNLNFYLVGMNSGADPCQNPTILKQFKSVSITSATTTQLIALSSGKVVYVCGLRATVGGTSPTLQFEYGTGTNCGNGTTTVTGAITPVLNDLINLSGEGTQFYTPAGNAVCLVSGGTPTIKGYLQYVQQ
jgi:hypothetical protein